MWFKNLFVYRLKTWTESPSSLEEKLAKQALQACGGLDLQTRGWVAPKAEGSAFVHTLGKNMLIALGLEKKLLPSVVVNQFAKARVAEIEEREGYKPGRKQMKEIKESVTDDLLPRAFAIRSKIYAWIDPEGQWLVIDTASASKADELVGTLIKSVEGLQLSLLKTKTSPTLAMTTWLAEKTSPHLFTVDQDCELKGRGEQGATVRYAKHNLEADDIAKHIQAGKDATKLALTWNEKISFVMHQNLQIKRLSPLDVIKEQAAMNMKEDDFDTDFALMTGELKKLLPALIEVLGGELSDQL